jgi:hypothetical protein
MAYLLVDKKIRRIKAYWQSEHWDLIPADGD